MTYSVEIMDLTNSHSVAQPGSPDGRIVAVKTSDTRIRDLAVKAEGVATWESSRDKDGTWIVFLAPAHGISIVTLRDYIIRYLKQSSEP